MAGLLARSLRDLWFEIHKYVGLTTFLFLGIAGLTDSLLVFRAGLDEALNPDLYRVAAAQVLPAAELARRLERSHFAVQVTRLPLTTRPGHAVVVQRVADEIAERDKCEDFGRCSPLLLGVAPIGAESTAREDSEIKAPIPVGVRVSGINCLYAKTLQNAKP